MKTQIALALSTLLVSTTLQAANFSQDFVKNNIAAEWTLSQIDSSINVKSLRELDKQNQSNIQLGVYDQSLTLKEIEDELKSLALEEERLHAELDKLEMSKGRIDLEDDWLIDTMKLTQNGQFLQMDLDSQNFDQYKPMGSWVFDANKQLLKLTETEGNHSETINLTIKELSYNRLVVEDKMEEETIRYTFEKAK